MAGPTTLHPGLLGYQIAGNVPLFMLWDLIVVFKEKPHSDMATHIDCSASFK